MKPKSITCKLPLSAITILDVRNHDFVLMVRKGQGSAIINRALRSLALNRVRAAARARRSELPAPLTPAS